MHQQFRKQIVYRVGVDMVIIIQNEDKGVRYLFQVVQQVLADHLHGRQFVGRQE